MICHRAVQLCVCGDGVARVVCYDYKVHEAYFAGALRVRQLRCIVTEGSTPTFRIRVRDDVPPRMSFKGNASPGPLL